MKPLLAFALLACLNLGSLPAAAAETPAPPNILFLLSDDHSYPFLSCYGNPNVQTPHIDRLAAGGMKFHRFFTSAPQCVPSRAALMTGRSPVAARITRFSSPLARDEVIFPELLREKAGYFTGVCGRSYHLDGSAKAGAAVSRTFEENRLRTFAQRMDFVDVSNPSRVAEKVIAFLDKKPKDKPFFLWVNFSNPHHPWDDVANAPSPASIQLPAHWPDLPGVREDLSAYFGEVNRLDGQVQNILEVLDRRGLTDRTLVVFCGDNGAALPHGKGSLYDPGLNVPFLVRWPGVVKNNTESRALISGEDLAPTLLEAAGVAIPPKITGKSFLKLLRGEPFQARESLYAERGPHGSAPVTVNMSNSGFDLSRCVRTDRFKFIYNCTPWIPYGPVDSAGRPGWKQMQTANQTEALAPALRKTYFTAPRPVYELYDLQTDPSELENLSGKPELAAVERRLRELLAEKMILDFDYLPLPDLGPDPTAARQPQNPRPRRAQPRRDR